MSSVTEKLITKTQAQTSLKKIYSEAHKLNPSHIITMFEIDISDLLFERGISSVQLNAGGTNSLDLERRSIFRFHNNINLTHSDIIWQGKKYIALPIMADGFEYAGSGTTAKPKLTISTIEDGVPALSLLKCQLGVLGDIIGAKVTRLRTFLKHIDKDNFLYDTNSDTYGIQTPTGYDPDATAEFPRDIFYIERKTAENKLTLQYELSSIYDLEGVKIPGRLIFANRCPFPYRGIGCPYEFASRFGRKNSNIHGDVDDAEMGVNGLAPPVATINDRRFKDIAEVGVNYKSIQGVQLRSYDKGEWDATKTYSAAEYVYVSKDGINYYYVAKSTIPANNPPPDTNYWIADQCSKTVHACSLRFGKAKQGTDETFEAARPLPFGGFPGAEKIK